LGESEFAAAGASVGIKPVKGDLFLFKRKFGKIDAGKLGCAIGV
jgi:hypothetical protein